MQVIERGGRSITVRLEAMSPGDSLVLTAEQTGGNSRCNAFDVKMRKTSPGAMVDYRHLTVTAVCSSTDGELFPREHATPAHLLWLYDANGREAQRLLNVRARAINRWLSSEGATVDQRQGILADFFEAVEIALNMEAEQIYAEMLGRLQQGVLAR